MEEIRADIYVSSPALIQRLDFCENNLDLNLFLENTAPALIYRVFTRGEVELGYHIASDI